MFFMFFIFIPRALVVDLAVAAKAKECGNYLTNNTYIHTKQNIPDEAVLELNKQP